MKKYLFVVCCIVIGLAASRPASATTVTLTVGAGGNCATLATCDRIIGEVFSTNDLLGGQEDRDAAAAAALILMTPGQRTGTNPEYYRSTTPFVGTPPTPTSTNAVGGGSTSFTLSQAFTYLVVSYDGPNGGGEVYWLGGLGAGDVINVVAQAHPNGVAAKNQDCGGGGVQPSCGDLISNTGTDDFYNLTHWTLLNPTTGTVTTFGSVPDGGTTATLLGLAMAGLGFIARRRK